ncbi:MAG TPA: Ig-like domain-containing protein [Terriglobales bacterium]|nr:Ig-like domain-containing protein [Terriglobales bacterium]
MATERKLLGKRLPLTIAFTIVLVFAFGVSCKGFFQPNTLSSIAIQPSDPQVNVGHTLALQAWGTYSDNTRAEITSGVGWSSDTTDVATVDGTGSATLTGVSPGSATITASAQGISGTASATVVGNVTQITVSPTTASLTIGGSGQAFTFAATPGPPSYITADNGGSLNINPTDSFFTCVVGVDGSNNPAEVCSVSQGAAPQYTLSMSYPSQNGGTITSNTATITVH